MKNPYVRKALAAGVMLSVAGGAFAQSSIEEVVVTSRKRAESLQEVPISVTALTEAQIEGAGIARPADFISLIPNITLVDSANVGDTQVSIRGIVSTRDAESTFAYVVDGVLVTNPNGFNEELLDVSQIEVLKGPQGALYGRNAVAGAIIVTTNKPDGEAEAQVKVGVGNNNARTGSAVFSGALIEDELYGRISISRRETDGFFSNVYLGRDDAVDYMEDTTVRGRLVWDASDELTLDLRGGVSEVTAGAINFNAVFAIPQFETVFNQPAYFTDVNKQDFIFSFNVPGENEQETVDFSLKADWDTDGIDVTAILSYSDLQEYLLSDGTSASFYGYEITDSCVADRATLNNMPAAIGGGGREDLFGPFFAPFGVFPPGIGQEFAGVYGPYTPTSCDGYQYQERNQTDTSFELRLTSPDEGATRWIAGIYGAEIERESIVAYGADTGAGFLRQSYVPPSGPNPTDLLFSDQFDTSVLAVFGQIEVDLSDTMELAFAARYDREERDITNQVPNVNSSGLNINAAGQPINPAFTANPGGIPNRNRTFNQFQPKVTWSWKADENINVFASWGVGFRSGGFNAIGTEALLDLWYGDTCPAFVASCAENGGPGVAVDANLQVKDEYEKEVSTSFEVGAKMDFFDNRLRLNTAVFQTTVDDNQFFEFFAGPFGLMRAVTTIEELQIRGFEADFRAILMPNLSVFGGAGFLSSEIKENQNRPLTVGNDAPQAPDQTYNLGGEFEYPIANGLTLVARADWQHVGEMAFHTLQGEQTPSIWKLFFGPGFDQDFSKAKRDAYDTINARVSLESEDWTVTLWGRNIADERYLEEIIPSPEFGGSFIHPSALRAYGIDFKYTF